MVKYHVNPASGRPNICRATVRDCPIGGQHYSSKEEAREHFEQENDNVPDAFTKAMMKNPRWAEIDAQINYTRDKKQELAEAYELKRSKVSKRYRELAIDQVKDYNKAYGELEKHLTEEEKAAMYEYTGITYDPINKLLKDREKFISNSPFQDRIDSIVARMDETIERIDSYLAKAPAKDRVVFRRLDQNLTQQFTSSEQWAKDLGFEPGKEITFVSYSSTTVDPGYIARTVEDDEHTSIVLVIKARHGAPVDYTNEDGRIKATQDREREILLPRNTAYRIKQIERVEFSSAEYDYEPKEVLTVFMEEC